MPSWVEVSSCSEESWEEEREGCVDSKLLVGADGGAEEVLGGVRGEGLLQSWPAAGHRLFLVRAKVWDGSLDASPGGLAT